MIAPDFRASENLEVLKPAKTFISYNYGRQLLVMCVGDNMYKAMENDLQVVQNVHN